MSEKFFVGRYSIIIPDNKYGQGILTNGECYGQSLGHILPAWWMYNWSLDGSKERETFSVKYNMSDNKMAQLCEDITTLFDAKKIGYPNVCFDLETAYYIHNKYFCHIPDTRIISIGLNEEEANLFIQWNESYVENIGEHGLSVLLKEKNEMDGSNIIGYEILGFDGGIFHTIHCEGLEKDICSTFEIELNRYGLFDTYDEAHKACVYIDNECDTEIALWQPWQVSEQK